MRDPRPAVLLVEDDHDIATLVAEVLEVEGFSVSTARNGRIGLELLRRSRPDVVLLDLMRVPRIAGGVEQFLHAAERATGAKPAAGEFT
jgi:DNA-binding response OmpR family regulator